MEIKLKEFRQKHNLYQADMAAILNIAQSSISRMELKPTADLSYNQYQTLCDKFGIEEVEMFKADSAIPKALPKKTPSDNQSALDIIGQLTSSLVKLTEKQIEQSDRLISLLEKMERRAL